jgi:adenylate cyclase
MSPAVDPVRGSVRLVARLLEFGTAPARELARFGSDSLLAALLALLGGLGREGEPGEPGEPDEPTDVASAETEQTPRADLITRSLLAGRGRYTRLQVAEKSGISVGEARRLWRAVGFPEVEDEQRIFTSADVAALKDVGSLIGAGVLDADGAVELARSLGHLLSRLAVAQTGFISEVLGDRLAAGHAADDPQLPERVAEQAVQITRELLPALERTTLYVWRRHLATEAGRALQPLPASPGSQIGSPRTVVGFVDIAGFTRLTRSLDVSELAALLERFETLTLDTVVAHSGRVIKNLGDEVLFMTDQPEAAAEIALTLIEQIDADDRLPPVHAGLAMGPVLSRGGDVFGPVVNIAARIATLARRGTVRVDERMAAALVNHRDYELWLRAPRHVRGYVQLRSYRLRRAPAPKR